MSPSPENGAGERAFCPPCPSQHLVRDSMTDSYIERRKIGADDTHAGRCPPQSVMLASSAARILCCIIILSIRVAGRPYPPRFQFPGQIQHLQLPSPAPQTEKPITTLKEVSGAAGQQYPPTLQLSDQPELPRPSQTQRRIATPKSRSRVVGGSRRQMLQLPGQVQHLEPSSRTQKLITTPAVSPASATEGVPHLVPDQLKEGGADVGVPAHSETSPGAPIAVGTPPSGVEKPPPDGIEHGTSTSASKQPTSSRGSRKRKERTGLECCSSHTIGPGDPLGIYLSGPKEYPHLQYLVITNTGNKQSLKMKVCMIYMCSLPIQGREFARQWDLGVHEYTAHKIGVLCEGCGKHFNTGFGESRDARALEQHRDVCKGPPALLTCRKCQTDSEGRYRVFVRGPKLITDEAG